MREIVIGTDGSPSGRAAVEYGIELARPSGARVTIVCVLHAPSPVLGDPYYQRALGAELDKGRSAVQQAATLAEAAGLDCETVLLTGNPADKIPNAARARGADLIVVGSRSDSPLAGALLGSVSRRVLHHARCPVLVVTPRSPRVQIAA